MRFLYCNPVEFTFCHVISVNYGSVSVNICSCAHFCATLLLVLTDVLINMCLHAHVKKFHFMMCTNRGDISLR